jgi:hypothetical protein
MSDTPPASLQVGLPLWYLVHRGTAEVNEPADPITLGVSIGHILIKLDWGDGTALAMFTDERRACEFAAGSGLIGLLSNRVGTTTQLQDLLARLDAGTTHIGFDPPPPGPGRGTTPVVPVSEILGTLRTVDDGD